MQDDKLKPDLVVVENSLRSLMPVSMVMNRDHLLYSAGVHSGTCRHRRVRRLWQTATAGLILLVLGLSFILISPGETRVAIAVAKNGQPSASLDTTDRKPQPGGMAGEKQTPSPVSQAFYSSIWNIDGWSPAELQRNGISVKPGKRDLRFDDELFNELPLPVDKVPWVCVEFSADRFPNAEDVVMSVEIVSHTGAVLGGTRVSRAESTKGTNQPLKLHFVLPEQTKLSDVGLTKMELSDVVIRVYQAPKANAPQQIDGSPEFGGYRLSLRRIRELIK